MLAIKNNQNQAQEIAINKFHHIFFLALIIQSKHHAISNFNIYFSSTNFTEQGKIIFNNFF
jgi:hypothetical protein